MAKTIFFSYVSVHLYPCGRVYRDNMCLHPLKDQIPRILRIPHDLTAEKCTDDIPYRMEKVQMSVPKMYSDKNELIELPKQFTELERQMNQVRLQNYTNAQAAKEANQRKNDMIMYMAHDLKTPLTSVIGYLTLVSQEPYT